MSTTASELERNTRRINRRTAFVVFNDMDRHKGASPGIVQMMRDLVRAFGVDGALDRCKFPSHVPQEAIEIQRLCCEYLAFEEGAPDEQRVIDTQKEAERQAKSNAARRRDGRDA